MRRNIHRGVRWSGTGRNIGRSGVRYLWMKNVVLWTKSALMDEKRHFMDQICTLWTRIAFMDEKRRFMDQICTLWTRFALMDEKRIFHGENEIPALMSDPISEHFFWNCDIGVTVISEYS